MHRTGHLGAAVLCWAVAARVFLLPEQPTLAVLGGVVCVWLAPLPDVDLDLPLRHRGQTHSLVFTVLTGAVVGIGGRAAVVHLQRRIVDGEPGLLPRALFDALPGFVVDAFVSGALSDPSVVGFAVGLAAGTAVLSHVLADSITPLGVELLWPLTEEQFSVDVVRASNPVANYGLLASGGGALALLVASRFVALGELVTAGELPI